jgi:hypothetical protein
MKRVWLEREGSGKGLVPKQAGFYRLGPRDKSADDFAGKNGQKSTFWILF